MKRFPLVATLFLIPALSLLWLAGCTQPPAGKGKDKDKDKDKDGKNNTTLIDLKDGDGVIKGIVKIKGTAPDPGKLDMSGHKDKTKCEAGGEKHVKKQQWLVNKDGAVENVVIWLEAPDGKQFKVDNKVREGFKKPAVLDQPYCQYVPRMLAVYADVQPITVKNTAEVTHNVKIEGGAKNGNSNFTMEPKGKDESVGPYKKADPIPVSCQIHPWMIARIHIFDHPYFAVTKEDGSFEIHNVPVGEELTIVMMHEEAGRHTQKLTTKSGANDVKLELPVK